MGSVRVAGGPDIADLLAGFDLVPDRYPNLGQVGVAGLEAVGMLDHDEVAVRTGRAGVRDDAAGGGRDRRAGRRREVEAFVLADATFDRIDARAVARAWAADDGQDEAGLRFRQLDGGVGHR